MANTNEFDGTQTASIGTEHTLCTPTTAGNRCLKVDLVNLAATEVVELRIYDKVLTGDTAAVVYASTYNGPHSGDPIVVSVPVPQVFTGGKMTLKQTTGTGRAFKWACVLLG